MKKISTCALVVALASFTSSLEAASLRVETRVTGASNVFSIYLDALTEADQVTALSVSMLPINSAFENYSETGFGPAPDFDRLDENSDASFTSATLTLPAGAPFFGMGWTIIDGSDEVAPPSGPAGIGYAASAPGRFLEADGVLLNNIMLPQRATVVVAMVDLFGGDGNLVQQLCVSNSPRRCIPEPTSMALAGLVTIALVAARKRN